MYLTNATRLKSFFLACSAAVVLSGCQHLPANMEGNSTALNSQTSSETVAQTILEWWDGDYNNEVQIQALKDDGAPIWQQGQYEEGKTFGGHLPVNSYYRPISLPAFGDKVLYLEEYTFDDNPYRQRIYTVIKDQDADEVRVKLWYFKDREKYLGAWQDLSRLEALTPEDMSPLPDNCDLYVKVTEDGRLHMQMPKNQCKFGANIFDYQVILSADDFWFRDRIVDAETLNVTMTAGSFTYHKLDKIK